MNTTAHDFVTVDMRGLKAALVARAQAERVTVSVLVRRAVARDLGVAGDGEASRMDEPTEHPSSATAVKLSIRMSAEEARQLARWLRKAIKETEDKLERAGRTAGQAEGSADGFTLQIPGVGWEFPLKDAVSVILATAGWLEQVADLGFGVKAWS